MPGYFPWIFLRTPALLQKRSLHSASFFDTFQLFGAKESISSSSLHESIQLVCSSSTDQTHGDQMLYISSVTFDPRKNKQKNIYISDKKSQVWWVIFSAILSLSKIDHFLDENIVQLNKYNNILGGPHIQWIDIVK